MNYRSFTKLENVIWELKEKLELFDNGIMLGVRGLSKGEYNNRVVVPYQNCRYLGELAERCEERGLATDAKSLRSILISFIMETKNVKEEDFLYNQFEIFEEIYKRILGKNFSILDEILLKKCKFQVSGEEKDFELNYDTFTEKDYKESSLEEQAFVILALTSYRPSVSDDEKEKYDNLLDKALRLFSENNPATLDVVSYVSLAHVYDYILALTKSKEIKSFSKKEKNFYKCIKDVVLSDLSSVFDDSKDIYKQETVTICDYVFELEKLVELSYQATKYKSSEFSIKKVLTLPAKCRKISRHFNYHLSKGVILIDDIKDMDALYSKQNKEFYQKYILEYVKMDLIEDAYLYCDFLNSLSANLFRHNRMDELIVNNPSSSNFNVIKEKIKKELTTLYDNKEFDKISNLRERYSLFSNVLTSYSLEDPVGFAIDYDVKKSTKAYWAFSTSEAKMLLRNNCIDLNLDVTINGVVRSIDSSKAGYVTSAAWEENKFSFAIALSRKYKEAYQEFLRILKLSRYGYNRSNETALDVLNKALDKIEHSTDEYELVIDAALSALLRANKIQMYKSFIKDRFDEIVAIYNFSSEDKEDLIKELLLENIDVEKLEFYPDRFLIDTIGIEEAFRLLNVDEESVFKIKMKFINAYSNSRYASEFTKRCVELLKNSLTADDLNAIEIKKHRDKVERMASGYLHASSDIAYFEKNKDMVFGHCIDKVKEYLEYVMTKNSYENAALLYVYFKSKDIKDLEEILERINQMIIDYCLNVK